MRANTLAKEAAKAALIVDPNFLFPSVCAERQTLAK
jgi:hypothetical protein